MPNTLPLARAARTAVFLLVFAVSAFAATVTKLNEGSFAALHDTRGRTKIRLDSLPLYDGRRSAIELEEFQVWAPDGKVAVHGGPGRVTYLPPPRMRYFRGTVNADPASFAYFSVEETSGKIYALIETHDRKYAVSGVARRTGAGPRHRLTVDEGAPEGFDYFLVAEDASDAIPQSGATWSCGASSRTIIQKERPVKAALSTLVPLPTAASGTQRYEIRLNVETDFELFSVAGTGAVLSTYVTNLTGALATVYSRDLRTNVVLGTVGIYTTASDPWTAIDALGAVSDGTKGLAGLNELGDYYHLGNNGFPAPPADGHSAVVMLSARDMGLGIAWEGTIGGADVVQDGHWVGAFAYCAGIGNLFGISGLGVIPGVNTPPYGMPDYDTTPGGVGPQDFWPLAEFTHELGHNLAGHHTHCVAITSGEAAGTNHPSILFVDGCQLGESQQSMIDGTFSPCAASSDPATAPLEKGTIMSYCHNVYIGVTPQSRFTFGQSGEVSMHEINDYMLNASGPLSPYGGANNIANSTPTATAISAPSSVNASSTGNTASITVTGNGIEGTSSTILWSITGGAITGGTTSSSVTFTAGASGSVVLTVKVTNNRHVTLTDTKSIPINAVTVAPPTNVVAAGTSSTTIHVTWTASVTGGVTGYNVYRSLDNAAYTLAGSTASLAFDDTVSTNKACMYKVRAVAGVESADSNKDFGVALAYADTLSAGTTFVRAAQIAELRTAAAAMRTLVSAGATTTFAESIVTGTTLVKASHISELRTFISGARTVLLGSGGTFTTTPASGSPISVADIQDLRNAAK